MDLGCKRGIRGSKKGDVVLAAYGSRNNDSWLLKADRVRSPADKFLTALPYELCEIVAARRRKYSFG